MRSNGFILIAGLIVIVLTDTAFGYQIKRYLRTGKLRLAYLLHSLFFVAVLIAFRLLVPRLKGPEGYFWIEKSVGLFFLFYAPKLIFILVNGIGLLVKKTQARAGRWISGFATGIAGLLFLAMLYGMTIGRYQYKKEVVEVVSAQIPASFRGFRIVQLTDLHLGSFGKSYPGLHKLVKEVNALSPDVIVFTGDIVNNFADEMNLWIKVLEELKAPYGKYAITGNHDYGDYTRWETPEAKQRNFDQYLANMAQMGFRMLNNAHVPLVAGQDTLWLAGVENWGKPPFPQYGNLAQALDSIPDDEPVILLSHDPSHWRAEVLQHPNIFLTLSGHTHAMQMGIRIRQWEWSPSQYIYPEYDGLYREGKQYIHVSRGQGYLGFPGRIGLRPVITEIKLSPQ